MRYKWMLVSVVAAAACGRNDNPVSPPGSTDASAYRLVSGNGAPLPIVTVDGQGAAQWIYYGALTLKDDHTYIREQRDSTRQQTGSMGYLQRFDYGTWLTRGDSIFLETTLDIPVRYPPGKGTRDAASVRLTFGTTAMVFSKQ
jgi:hypothetical protein